MWSNNIATGGTFVLLQKAKFKQNRILLFEFQKPSVIAFILQKGPNNETNWGRLQM